MAGLGVCKPAMPRCAVRRNRFQQGIAHILRVLDHVSGVKKDRHHGGCQDIGKDPDGAGA